MIEALVNDFNNLTFDKQLKFMDKMIEGKSDLFLSSICSLMRHSISDRAHPIIQSKDTINWNEVDKLWDMADRMKHIADELHDRHIREKKLGEEFIRIK